MYSLFFRIFVSFWGIVLVAQLIAVWGTVVLGRTEARPMLQRENAKFLESSLRAADVLRKQGMAAFVEWKSDERNLRGIEALYVLNSDGQDIESRTLPADLTLYADDRMLRSVLDDREQRIENIFTTDVVSPTGEFYVVVTLFRPPDALAYMLETQRVAIGVVVSGIICFLLARYVSAPIVRLRHATQALAKGQLDARQLRGLLTRKDEFGALARDFDEMASRLNEMIAAQKQLLRDVSHELRSPLARIQIALGLARTQDRETATQDFDRIEREANRLNTLIDELLTLVRMSSTKNAEPPAPIELCELLRLVVDDTGYKCGSGRPTNRVMMERCDPALVLGNEALLYGAIENVVNNACDYSPADAHVVVRCIAEYNRVVVSVTDNGPGIPANMLSSIFDPFVRVSSVRENVSGGYGVGLAIAKRAIESHGGTIVAKNESEEGAGLTVTIQLPIHVRERRAIVTAS